MSTSATPDHTGRRRRVLIMQSEGIETGEMELTVPERAPQRESKPKPLRESDLPQSQLTAFRRACGQTTALIVRISSSESNGRPQTILWDRPSLLIGRSRESDVRLSHAEVGRQHAFLQIVDGRVHCSDLGTQSGTYWSTSQGNRQHGWVEWGEAISIGPYSLTIEPAAQHGTFEFIDDETCDQDSLPEGLFLDFQDGENGIRRWPATRDVTLIGSGACAKVKLVHGTVSKAHCAIVRAGHALWVIDLLSEEGTLVNGELVSVARLESGDEMRVGRFAIAVHYGSPLDRETIEFSSDSASASVNHPMLTTGGATTKGTPVNGHPPNGHANNPLAKLQEQSLAAAKHNANGGVSEQFVLDVINQLGVMQQQALQQAQASMVQALQAVTTTYQGRIEALEDEHASLKRELRLLPGPTDSDERFAPGGPSFPGDYGGIVPLPPNMVESEFEDLPEPEHGSYEAADPEDRERWVRQKMKLVESELDKTRKGWGKKLIDLMGY